ESSVSATLPMAGANLLPPAPRVEMVLIAFVSAPVRSVGCAPSFAYRSARSDALYGVSVDVPAVLPNVLPNVLPDVLPNVLPVVLPDVTPDVLPNWLPDVAPDVLANVLPVVLPKFLAVWSTFLDEV